MKHKILSLIAIAALLTGVLSIATSATSVGDANDTSNVYTNPVKLRKTPDYFLYKGADKYIMVEDVSYITEAVARQNSGSVNGYTIRYGARDVTANSVYSLNAYVSEPGGTNPLHNRSLRYEAFSTSSGLYKGGSMEGITFGFGQFVTSDVTTYQNVDGEWKYVTNGRLFMDVDNDYKWYYNIVVDYVDRDVLGNLSRHSLNYTFDTSLPLSYPFVSLLDPQTVCMDRDVLANICQLPVGTAVTSMYVDVDIVSASSSTHRPSEIVFSGDFVSPSLDAQVYANKLAEMSHSDEEVNRSFVDWIFTAIGAFFSYPMFYVGTVAVTPYAIFAFVLGFACVMWMLKLFNGG